MTTQDAIPPERIRSLAKAVDALVSETKKKRRYLDKIREFDSQQKKRSQEQALWDKRQKRHLQKIVKNPDWRLKSVHREEITRPPPRKGWEPIQDTLHDEHGDGIVCGWGPPDLHPWKRPSGQVDPWDFDEERDADLAEQYYVLAVIHDSVYRQAQFQLIPLALKPSLKPPNLDHKKRLWNIRQAIYQNDTLKKPGRIAGEHEPILDKYLESVKTDLASVAGTGAKSPPINGAPPTHRTPPRRRRRTTPTPDMNLLHNLKNEHPRWGLRLLANAYNKLPPDKKKRLKISQETARQWLAITTPYWAYKESKAREQEQKPTRPRRLAPGDEGRVVRKF